MIKLHKYLLPAGTKVLINIVGAQWVSITTIESAILTAKDIYKLLTKDYTRADQQLYDILITGKNIGINYHFWIQEHRVEIKPTTLKILV